MNNNFHVKQEKGKISPAWSLDSGSNRYTCLLVKSTIPKQKVYGDSISE